MTVNEIIPNIERASTTSLRGGLQLVRRNLRGLTLTGTRKEEADKLLALLQSEISRRAD